MTRRTVVLAVMLLCIGLPPAFVLIAASASYSANRTTGTIVTSAGQTREYILHLPKTYDAARPMPLVISIHGADNWPAFQMDLTQWNKAADAHGFIAVYPGGQGGGPKIWHLAKSDTPAAMPDVIFISELLDRLEAKYNIDRSRIYVNGLSNGGGASFALSCTLANRIAAFGPVAAAITLPIGWCPDRRPAPVIAFHGTADRFTPYHGAKVWLAPEPFPDIPEWIAAWARRNRCAANAVDAAVAVDVTKRTYSGCAEGADVELYTIIGGGHTWPGGPPMPEWMVGPTSRSIDATEVMWAFFARHSLRVQNP